MSIQPKGRTPAGFYPGENGRERYWDGEQWTDRYADLEARPAPPGAPIPPAKKSWIRRHKILTGLAAVILLFIVIGISNAVKGSTPTVNNPAAPAPVSASATASQPATSAAPAPSPAPAAPGLNAPVRDGKFEFVVSKVECGKTEIGAKSLAKKAQGQFCIVSLSAKNIGDESQYLDASSQKAMDAQGRKFSADSAAGIYLGDNGNTFLKQINPGNAVQGQVVFDIPKDAKISQLELHDSPFSGGVAVALG
jgi:hypothetical protein